MLERLTANVLHRFLSQYFDHDGDDQAAIWSGFVKYQNLHLRVEKVNQKLDSTGQPIRIEAGFVRSLTITVPWGKLASSDSPVVVVLDGVFLLSSLDFDFDDQALRRGTKERRRRQLQIGSEKIGEDRVTWKEFLKKKLQDGLLPALAVRVEILIRDFHLRVENTSTSNPYAFGVVMESLHVKRDSQKFSQFNHFAVYMNSIESLPFSQSVIPENSVLRVWSHQQIVLSLDRMVPRRISDVNALSLRAPAHTYLLVPVDGTVHATFATVPQQIQSNSPIARFVLHVPHLSLEVRDLQCIQLLELYYENNTHKYRRQHYRPHRPYGSVKECPRRWWRYAYTVVRLELHKYRRSFVRRFRQRNRYCELYQRRLVGSFSADDAAGPSGTPAPAKSSASTPLLPLSLLEEQELCDLEDGVEGDLSVEDILLFRILVHKRVGYAPTLKSSSISRKSWFKRVCSQEDEAEQDYQRLVADWNEWAQKQAKSNEIASAQGLSPVAISAELDVESGHVVFFSPLPSTCDQIGLRRLQQKFLHLTFSRFTIKFELMRNFASLCVQCSLHDFAALELRSDQHHCTVVEQVENTRSESGVEKTGVLEFRFSKHTPDEKDYHMSLHARVRSLVICLQQEAEWIAKMKSLVKPLPQFEKATKFWKELSMASLNAYVSHQLGLLVKANTIVAEHKNMNLDVVIDCPILRISDGLENYVTINLGKAQLRTEKLAGVADVLLARLPQIPGNPDYVHNSFSADQRISGQTTRLKQTNVPDFPIQSRVGCGNNQSPSLDSVDFCASNQIDDSASYIDPAEAEFQDADLRFYDVYQMYLEPVGVVMHCADGRQHQLLLPLQISISFLKSVLPADHTISRYKFRLSIPEFTILLSEQSIELLKAFHVRWSMTLSRDIPSRLNVEDQNVWLDMKQQEELESESSGSESSFNENEFFDAAESDIFASDHAGVLPDDSWAADAESLFDTETRSFKGRATTRETRRRQLSEVSSLSDASVRRRFSRSLQGASYLSAENLARLEEDAAGEDSDAEADVLSFHSAVSSRHLEVIRNSLMEDIQGREKHLQQLREYISSWRRQSGGKGAFSAPKAKNQMGLNSLRLELLRSEAELKALHAALIDIVALSTSMKPDQGAVYCGDRTLLSLKRATSLIQSNRGTERLASVSDIDHTLTKTLKRESLSCSFSILQFRLQLILANQKDSMACPGDSVIDFLFTQNIAVLRQIAGKSRSYACIENLEGSLTESRNDMTHRFRFLTGGVNYELAGSLLPSRFPQLISPLSTDDKFLRCAIEMKRSPGLEGMGAKLIKMNLCLGEIEFTTHAELLTQVRSIVSRWKSHDQTPSLARKSVISYQPTRCDLSVRVSAARLLLYDSKIFAACVVSDCGIRFVKFPLLLRHERVQLSGSCSNVQLLWIHEYESGSGMEVFSKQETSSPIACFRMRYQETPGSETEGWVSCLPSTSLEMRNASEPWVKNSHIGLKIESLSAVITPSIILGIERASRVLGTPFSSGSLKEPSDQKPVRIQALRWRIDFSLKKSSVAYEAGVNDTGGAFQGEEHIKKILFSFSALAVVQPSISIHSDMVLQLRIQDFFVIGLPASKVVLEPTGITLTASAPLPSQFPKAIDYPQLIFPEKSFWTVSSQVPAEYWTQLDSTSQVNALISISTLRIQALPSASVLLFDLSSCLSHLKVKKKEYPSKLSVERKEKESKSFKLHLELDGVLVGLTQDQGTVGGSRSRVVFELDGVQVTTTHVPPKKRLTVSIDFGSITDQSVPSGIVSLSGGRRRCRTVSPTGSDGAGCALMTLNYQESCLSTHCEKVLGAHIGKVNVLPLPTCVRSALDFLNSVKVLRVSSLDQPRLEEQQTQISSNSSVQSASLNFDIKTELIEFTLASKDIPQYIGSSANDPVSVVTFRLIGASKGSLSSSGDGIKILLDTCTVGNPRKDAAKRAMVQYLSNPRDTQSRSLFCEVDVRIKECQLLRTTITRSPSSPVSFILTPPSAGEQRITNAFDFSITYRLACWTFAPHILSKNMATTTHSIHLHAGFVDLLLYIRQSAGGINDALKTSVVPILDMFKSSRKASQSTKRVEPQKSFKDMILHAPCMISIRMAGLKVTCVPGGATRLTESPIMKVSLTNLGSGFALTSVSLDQKILSITSSVSNSSGKHVFTGGWLTCSLSASYHNRRLVEWEPFIEPWILNTLVGIDLSRTTTLGSLPESGLDVASGEEPQLLHQDMSGSRLKRIGRLLRSPFQSDHSSRNASDFDVLNAISSDVDFCYLSLLLWSPEITELALHPFESIGETPLYTNLPHDKPIQWLNQFGFPVDVDPIPIDFTNQPAFICRVTDSATLNINITGALIETVSDYLDQKSDDPSGLPPHWIQNDSGLTLRFQEILESEQLARWETAPKVTMACDTKLPLSLKRSVSQSCEPHMAFISIELGSFEDTISRVNIKRLAAQQGSRSNSFSYKIKDKVPVDAVGFQRYPIDWNTGFNDESGSTSSTGLLGWIIVRVVLAGGTKMVFIESSLFLRNFCDADILCEIRDHDGLSLIWRSLLPKANSEVDVFVPVPADIVPNQSYRLSAIALPKHSRAQHESEILPCEREVFTHLNTPQPYSRSSLSKGIIDQRNVSLQVLGSDIHWDDPMPQTKVVNLNMCSIRIGAITLEQMPRAFTSIGSLNDAPEQRMLVFRSTLSVANHLAFPVRIQVRVKTRTSDPSSEGKWVKQPASSDTVHAKWSDLGILDCGKVVSWTGAASSDRVELRLRFERSVDGFFHKFFEWSSVTTVPSDEPVPAQPNTSSRPYFSLLPDIKLLDSNGTPLWLSVALCGRNAPTDASTDCSSVKSFAKQVQTASRVVGIFARFWVVDGTFLDLQYKSGLFMTGGSDSCQNQGEEIKQAGVSPVSPASLGLAELLDGQDFSHLPSRQSFEVLMIGNEGSKQLQIRRRGPRLNAKGVSHLPPWSDPISLSLPDGSYHDAIVLPAPEFPSTLDSRSLNGCYSQVDTGHEVFALRTRILKAPEIYGGYFGTRLVHVVCRYQVVNELGCSIEVRGTQNGMTSRPIVVNPDSLPHPIHFNDTRSIQFRPKEYGWAWSGHFRVRGRRELTMCLRHELKDTRILATVEFHSKQKSGTCFIVFRIAPYAPYRLENRTVHAIQYRQITPHCDTSHTPRNISNNYVGPLVLPYHDVEFAWEDPESVTHSIELHLASCDDQFPVRKSHYIGTIKIDRISPGSDIQFRSKQFSGQMVADGPTRVIRIIERPGGDSQFRHNHEHSEQKSQNYQPLFSAFTWKITMKLLRGVGLSLVDWTPQELLFMSLEDVFVEKFHCGAKRTFTGAIGRITVDNQLWVTPFPVLLQVGSKSQRKRHRRHSALLLSWRRKETSGIGYGNTTMFEAIKLTLEPMNICLDGNLTRLLLAMLQQLNEVRSMRNTAGTGPVAKSLAPTVLEAKFHEAIHDPCNQSLTDTLNVLVDRLSTTPIAAKLRLHNSEFLDGVTPHLATHLLPSSIARDSLSRNRHKYYIERLWISTIAAEISWSGALPNASSLPVFLLPSFTFQGLPILFRPLSISNAYGATNDHVDCLRSHYMSIWRIFDLLAGILTKTSFLNRSVILSWRESLGSAFETLTRSLKASESMMVKLTTAIQAQSSPPILWALLGPFVKFNLILVHSLGTVTSAGSRIFRYHVSQYIATGSLIRSRNPRLLANVNGRDLLVDYVEGENAGKAFLSRVAMGIHLCEGYNYHLEGVFLSTPAKKYNIDPTHFIIILTFERVMLVSGRLNETFCDVVWKALFTDVMCVEVRESDDVTHAASKQFVCLQWWVHSSHISGSLEERFAQGLISDVGGLAAISSCQMLVPKQSSRQLLRKLEEVVNLRSINLMSEEA